LLSLGWHRYCASSPPPIPFLSPLSSCPRLGPCVIVAAMKNPLSVALLGLLVAWPALAAGQTIKVGAVVPLTGRYGGGGAQVRAGYEIGVEHVNAAGGVAVGRSEEHTSELQSRVELVCRLLLEKKKQSRI